MNITVHDVDNDVATGAADPNSSDYAHHDKQQQTGQSMETTEGDESNAEDSKTMQENNNDTPVLGSTVSKKNNIFHFGKYCLYYLSHIITFFVRLDIGVSISTWDAVIQRTTTKAAVQ